MCRKIPFNPSIDTTDGDLPDWADFFLGMSKKKQAEEVDRIRREINIANAVRCVIRGETTRLDRPNIVPEMAPE